MTEEHVGSMVSVDCGDALGVYEGCVVNVDSVQQTLTLKDPKRNGVIYPVAKVTLRAADIHDLKVVKTRNELGASTMDRRSPNKSPKKSAIHYSKSFQSQSALTHKPPTNAASKISRRRRSQTPDPPSSNFGYDHEVCSLTSHNNYDSFGQSKHSEIPQQRLRNSHSVGGDSDKFTGQNRNYMLSKPSDMSSMEEDFDFEANLALFDKSLFKNEFLAANAADPPPKLNYRHDEYILDNPSDVYRGASKSYKYRTESGNFVNSLTIDDKRVFFDLLYANDVKSKENFVIVYSLLIVQCLLDSLGENKNYENLSCLLVLPPTTSDSIIASSSLVDELSKHVEVHLGNRQINVKRFVAGSGYISTSCDFAVLFGVFLNKDFFDNVRPSSVYVVETDWTRDPCTLLNVKSMIFWHSPVSDCDVKSSSIYLCDVGLRSKDIIDKYRVKNYQVTFGAKFFTKLLKL